MSPTSVLRFEADAVEVPLVHGAGRAASLDSAAGAPRERSVTRFELGSDAASVDLRHDREAVYHVVEGGGRIVDTDTGAVHAIRSDVVAYVAAGQGYRIEGPAVVVGGPCPPDSTEYETPAAGSEATILVLDPEVHGVLVPLISRRAWLTVSPHMGASYAVMNVVELEPGEKNTPHVHSSSEDSIFLLAGSGWVHDLDAGVSLALEAGSLAVVPAGVRRAVEAGEDGMRSVGGPVPPDFAMLRAAKVDLPRS